MALAAGGPSGPSPLQPLADHFSTLEPDQASQPLATDVEGVSDYESAVTGLSTISQPPSGSTPDDHNPTVTIESTVHVSTDGDGGNNPQPLEPHENRRAVNSFMVFRAYMEPFLPGWTQAKKSMLLGALWAENQHKGHFALIGAAYTILRNNYALHPPSLPSFVSNISPYLFNLPSPTAYIQMSGWALEDGEGATSRRSWFTDYSHLDIPVLLSVDDLVQISLALGLATPRPNLADDAAVNDHASSSATRAPPATGMLVSNQADSIAVNSIPGELSELTLEEVFGSNIEGLERERDLDYNYMLIN